MALNLVELIKASGGAGTAGQTFLTNVTGAGNGIAMRSYLVGSVGSISGTPNPPGETAYASGSTFSLGVSWSNYGSQFSNIRRNGTTPWSHIGTATVSIDSVSWASNVSTVGITVTGDYDSATLQTLNTFNIWFDGYTSPTYPTGAGGYSVSITPVVNGSSTPSGFDDRTIQLTYDPDTAAFNTLQTTSSYSIRVNKRAYELWTTRYEWEVHGDSGYGSLLGTSSYTFTSYESDVIDFYLRYRVKAAYNGGTPGSWTNFGLLSWSDPRPDV